MNGPRRDGAEFLCRLTALARRRLAPRGSTLFESGDEADALWLVVDGAADLFVETEDGIATVAWVGAGSWLGVEAALSRAPHVSGARVAIAGIVAIAPRTAVAALLAERPEGWAALHRVTRDNISHQLGILTDRAALPPSRRLARRLLSLANADGLVHATRAELGELVGATLATVHRAFRDLAEIDAIEAGYRHIAVRDRAALERFAAGEA